MRNLPNFYISYSPGMPIMNGVPGSFVDMLKKVLVTGTDPVSFSTITVLDNLATITSQVENEVFFNGSQINITGCSEPLLNNVFEVEEHTLTKTIFKVNVADGDYTGNIKVNLLPAGWNLLFSGTNEAVFVSGNADTIGVCIRVIDTNARYATLEFYENMTSINTGINKFNNAIFDSANRVIRFYKSVNATSTKINYWIAADNTTVHISNERISNTTYTPPVFNSFRGGTVTSFGEMIANDSFNKRHFYYISPPSDTAASYDNYYYNHSNFTLGRCYPLANSSYASNNYINSLLFTESQGSKNWSLLAINTPSIFNNDKISGSTPLVPQSFNLPPFYHVSEYYGLKVDSIYNKSLSFFGKFKEILHFHQQVYSCVRNGTKVKINNKNYICLPIYFYPSYSAGLGLNENNIYLGMLPILIGEKWGE